MAGRNRELELISRAYHERLEEIEGEILSQLLGGESQTDVAERFGWGIQRVHTRAKQAGLTVYKSRNAKKGIDRPAKTSQYRQQNRKCAECKFSWVLSEMEWRGKVLVCVDCVESEK
ncbi:hypothetical protein [Streptomyces sp. NPDC006477]|uniref:hypothetical protein n=1 Tax=Streptomyces sp. NPDC006477 TaxID=3364747 RepID=UPI003693C82A